MIDKLLKIVDEVDGIKIDLPTVEAMGSDGMVAYELFETIIQKTLSLQRKLQDFGEMAKETESK